MNETKEVKDILAEKGEQEKMSPARRRDIVKTLIIVFLAIMLVLTFFSNTIMNKSLAEITTESVGSGKLVERIKGWGNVESNQSYDVTTDAGRTIEKINIKVGQEVRKGDVLFMVKNVSSEELETQIEKLEEAELSYEKDLLKEPTDYSKDNLKLRKLREELNAAIAKRDAAKANEGNLNAAKEEYRRNNSELKKLEAENEKLSGTVKSIDSDNYMDADVELIGDLPSLYNTYSAADEEYKRAREIYETAVEKGENAELAKADADSKEAARNTARDAYEQSKSSVREGIVARMNDIRGRIDELTAAVENYTAEHEGSKEESYEELAQAVISKQNEIEEERLTLENTKKTNSVTEKTEALELEAKKKALDKLREKVEKLKKETEATEIKATHGGIVSAVNVKLDDKTVEGNALATIDVAEEGYTITIQDVDAEKLRKVKKGTEAEVINNYRGDIQAVLKEIKNTSNVRKKDLVFTVTGDVSSGDRVDVSIPCGSGTYDAIVPRSAVHSDDKGNGSCVYIVRSKNTPLGNRYYAEKVKINIEAEDEVSYAVSGSLNRGDYVITAASKYVAPGDQVRMKDK